MQAEFQLRLKSPIRFPQRLPLSSMKNSQGVMMPYFRRASVFAFWPSRNSRNSMVKGSYPGFLVLRRSELKASGADFTNQPMSNIDQTREQY